MTEPTADLPVPVPEDDEAAGVRRDTPPSAAEGGEQWAAHDALLEGQPTALGE